MLGVASILKKCELQVILIAFVVTDMSSGLTESYQCSQTCYSQRHYTTSCGFLGVSRCTRYRQISNVCYHSCFRCATGWTGNNCNTPICSSCPNGGTCTLPNYCSCVTGYVSPNCVDVNECNSNNGGCDHTCHNTHGSYYCSCRSGYTLVNGHQCQDNIECNSNNGGCDQTCHNTEGSYYCSCSSGYTLVSGHQCQDVNECNSNNGGCDQTCHNTHGSYYCSCRSGYTLGNGHQCQDINECMVSPGVCEHFCHNSNGGYSCSCQTGYQVAGDGHACLDIDECLTNNGGCNQTCVNQMGSYICTCPVRAYKLAENEHDCIRTYQIERKYTILGKNKRINGYSIYSKMARSRLECATACIRESRCRSFNVEIPQGQSTGYRCELNTHLPEVHELENQESFEIYVVP